MGRVQRVNMWHQVGALFQEQEGTKLQGTAPSTAHAVQNMLNEHFGGCAGWLAALLVLCSV